jgi:phosphoribosylanthranilate isomerase
MTLVKICGLTNLEDALAAAQYGAQYVGFNFYLGSRRYITPDAAKEIARRMTDGIVKVGVFVNAETDDIVSTVETAGLDAIQLHGDETPDFVTDLKSRTGIEIIRAVNISSEFDPASVFEWDADAILVDAASTNGRGGTGQRCDWDIAREIRQICPKVYLAGGISPENAAEAIEYVRPYAVDVCSSIESSPGKKDAARMRRLFEVVNRSQ